MAATRLELAAVDVQEEARRLLGYVAWTLLAVCLAVGAIMLGTLFVILLFWDTHRLAAVAAMGAVLGLASLVVLARVRAALDARPAMLAGTLNELRNDAVYVRHALATESEALHEGGAHD